MRVGIGITTYKRPDCLRTCLSQIKKYTPRDAIVYVSDDSVDRKGVAYRKNDCLDVLWKAGCDYFFLLDDDCFPISRGWTDHYITAALRTGQEHFMYVPQVWARSNRNGVNITNLVSGVLLFLTRNVVRRVGAFMSEYGLYGNEHVTYTRRVHVAGFTSYGPHLSVAGAEKYIYAMDHDDYLPFNQDLHHRPTLSEEERVKCVEESIAKMGKDTLVYRPLPSKIGLAFNEPIHVITLAPHFEEMVTALTTAIRDAGYTISETRKGALCLVFGLHNWDPRNPLPQRYIAVQLEQHGFPIFTDTQYLERLRGAVQVWDYSWSNIEVLQKHQIYAIHVPIGYSPQWRYPALKKDIDFLMLGNTTGRRGKILEKLQRKGITVITSDQIFGGAKQALLARAKVVLNLHFRDQGVLEELRIAPALAAGCLVVSERSDRREADRVYQDHVFFVNKPGELAGACRKALRQVEQGHEEKSWIATRDISTLIPWDVIEQSEVDTELYGLYPDLQRSGLNTAYSLMDHWRRGGQLEGRLGRAPKGFDWREYARKNPDLAQKQITTRAKLIWHWVFVGKKEGRLT